MTRPKTYNIRLSAEEAARLKWVATEHGMSAAELIRYLLKREDDRELRVSTLETLADDAERAGWQSVSLKWLRDRAAHLRDGK